MTGPCSLQYCLVKCAEEGHVYNECINTEPAVGYTYTCTCTVHMYTVLYMYCICTVYL